MRPATSFLLPGVVMQESRVRGTTQYAQQACYAMVLSACVRWLGAYKKRKAKYMVRDGVSVPCNVLETTCYGRKKTKNALDFFLQVCFIIRDSTAVFVARGRGRKGGVA